MKYQKPTKKSQNQEGQKCVNNSSKVINQIFKNAKDKKKQQKKQESEKSKDQKMKVQRKKILSKKWKKQQKQRRNEKNKPINECKVQGGVKMYTEQQLNIGQGGNTKQCPFNCNCCF